MGVNKPLEMPPVSEAIVATGSPRPAMVDGGVLRKKLYNQPLSDWSARYRKNKQHLDVLVRDCEQLRAEVARQQQEVDDRSEKCRMYEEKYDTDLAPKHAESKSVLEMA